MIVIIEVLGAFLVGFLVLMCIIIAIGTIYYICKDIYYSKFKKPSSKEKLEMENTEFDYGHNVKNYSEEDYE